MSEIINANYFSPTENDNLLFDCNALMYIFYREYETFSVK